MKRVEIFLHLRTVLFILHFSHSYTCFRESGAKHDIDVSLYEAPHYVNFSVLLLALSYIHIFIVVTVCSYAHVFVVMMPIYLVCLKLE
jgi:hypothetical protein